MNIEESFDQEMARDLEIDEIIRQQVIPDSTKRSIDLYVNLGIPPGSFVDAVLRNDLKQAFEKADVHNTINMHAIVSYLYNNVPCGCWGSPANVCEWYAKFDEEYNDKINERQRQSHN